MTSPTHQSNWDANIGARNPGLTAQDFKKAGMSDTQAGNAGAAAK